MTSIVLQQLSARGQQGRVDRREYEGYLRQAQDMRSRLAAEGRDAYTLSREVQSFWRTPLPPAGRMPQPLRVSTLLSTACSASECHPLSVRLQSIVLKLSVIVSTRRQLGIASSVRPLFLLHSCHLVQVQEACTAALLLHAIAVLELPTQEHSRLVRWLVSRLEACMREPDARISAKVSRP
jgi:hypothetical protein